MTTPNRDLGGSLLERIGAVCASASKRAEGRPEAESITALLARLREPLRVAIAGRVNTGKSTLLNALVGERLAATDASECTRIVTWYRKGVGYDVRALTESGEDRQLRFTRSAGALEIDLAGLEPGDVERIDVLWPAARLEALTLIDSPGLAGIRPGAAASTLRLLGSEGGPESQVDAVIYLMRHLHVRDVGFLESFRDRSLPQASPATAIAVLSRADEAGAGRSDAMDSAAAIAARYAGDPRIQSLCAAVVPIAGLLAETAATLREEEVSALRRYSSLPEPGFTDSLLSVDRFCDAAVGPLPSQTRHELLLRLGMFGVRFSLDLLRRDPDATATDLAGALRRLSGIEALIALLDGHLSARARILKARSVLVGLRAVARSLVAADPDAAAAIETAVEQTWAGSTEFDELRLWQLTGSGAVRLEHSEAVEARRVMTGAGPAERLGAEPDTPPGRLADMASARIGYWRERAAHPLATRPEAEACDIVARAFEAVYGAVAEGNAGP